MRKKNQNKGVLQGFLKILSHEKPFFCVKAIFSKNMQELGENKNIYLLKNFYVFLNIKKEIIKA